METPGPSTVDKLAALTITFQDFQHAVEGSKQVRQNKEDDEIQALKASITRLENTLNQEVKRRDDTNLTIQNAFEAHMATVQERLEAGLLQRLDGLMQSVKVLNDRIGIVEEEFTTARQSYVRDMEDKSTLVADDIVALKATFKAERLERKERETLIIAKLRDLGERTRESMEKGDRNLDVQVAQLDSELGVVGHEEDRRFHEYVFTELAALKKGVKQESVERQQADDEIADTLTHYTQSVQEAARIVNQAY
jgi:hypothetical protein